MTRKTIISIFRHKGYEINRNSPKDLVSVSFGGLLIKTFTTYYSAYEYFLSYWAKN